MTTPRTTDWDDLETIPESTEIGAATKTDAEGNRTKYTCDHCAGSGQWLARQKNKYGNSKCNACGGRGYFLSSALDRQKKRNTRARTQERRTDEIQAEFEELNPGLIASLQGMVNWNDFAVSLLQGYAKYGQLTAKQTIAAHKMVAKVAATQNVRTEAKAEATVEVDLSVIRSMFETAFNSGHSKPTYRAEGLKISRAPDHGRNAGSLYVVEGESYFGRITEDNVFHPTREAAGDVADRLNTVAHDPKAASVRYGRDTGSCGCCGRELTNAESIAAGIGPICAQKWGF